jgi:predicted Rossmann fold flavoprotein
MKRTETVKETEGAAEASHSSILIIGGGAAGLAAAISARRAAEQSGISRDACSITLLERNPRTGTKLRLSGGGKCNVTHEGSPEELLEKGFIRRNEQRFLRNALYSFTNSDLLDLLHSRGVRTEARADGKVFPESGDASTVALAFEDLQRLSSVVVRSACRVKSVVHKDGVFHARCSGATFTADALILATGGVSYSRTGTTGDGLAIARAFGHSVVEPSAALSPVYTVKQPPAALSGVALRFAGLVASTGGRSVERRGDLLFTHRGFSGPAALSLSRDIAELLSESGSCQLFADLFPDHTKSELEQLFLRQTRKNGAQMVRKFLQSCPIAPLEGAFGTAPHGTIPTALVPSIMREAALDSEVTWSTLPREKRQSLLAVLKRFPLGRVRDVELDPGEVSAGGVSLAEVNPKSMLSRVVPNLFFCGELLDYAGEIGGYNLQAAFSTGWMAGLNAVKSLAPKA